MAFCMFVSFCLTWAYIFVLVNNIYIFNCTGVASLGSLWKQKLCIHLSVCSVSVSPLLSETTSLSNQVKSALKDIKLLQATWKQVAGTRTILLASSQRGKLQDNITFYSTLEFNKAEIFDWKMAPSIEETSSRATRILLDTEEPDHEIWRYGKVGSTFFPWVSYKRMHFFHGFALCLTSPCMFRKSDTWSSVTAAMHQRAFGRKMTTKYLKL